jgi:Skp family chaperone for outer membrane proteins
MAPIVVSGGIAMSDAMNAAAAAPSLLRASLARSGKWAGGVAFLGGIISDVLNPLAPFAAYIAFAAAIAALIIGIAIVLRLVLAERMLPALVFASTTATISGGLYAMQTASDAQDGLIATLVPAVAELQQTMGVVAAKVDKIENTVTETQEAVKDVQKTTENVEQQTAKILEGQQQQQEQADKLQSTTEEIAQSIDKIADGFAALAAQGGIIADPKRPDEFYHNARLHELSGDMLNARRSYLAFAGFDVDAIDPYIRFATLLRVQDGKAGAREAFGTLAARNKTLALQLVHMLQFDDQQRLEKLNAFITANPGYGPAYFLLSEEFSEDRLGQQALSDKRGEAEALTKFLAQEKDGGLVKYFIDHALLADWLDRARSRLTALGDVLDPSHFKPTLTSTRSNSEWMMAISLPEAATGISWRLGKEGPFTHTGAFATNDQRTGKPMPNPSFMLPADTPAGAIALKYLDLRGREVGPFEIPFNPETALSDGNKQILDQFWTSWIAFDASGNRGLVYFTHILSYRCAIKAVHYGLNNGPLDKAIEMPACDAENPYAIPNDYQPYFKVGDDIKSMSIKITYSDGTQSPVRSFKR